MTTAIEKELEKVRLKLQQTQQELKQSRAELHEAVENQERSQSQLDQVLGELEQTHFELYQYKEKVEQNQSGSELELRLKQELKETQSKLQETLQTLKQYHSQVEQTMEALEQSKSQLEQKNKELEHTKLQLHQAQQTSALESASLQLTPEKLVQAKSHINQMVVGLNQLLDPLQVRLELLPTGQLQTPVNIEHSSTNKPRILSPVLRSSSQQLKTETARETVVVAGVTMFKDEEDIAYYNLSWHYNKGIKRFVVLDNMSSDNTSSEVKRFANDYPDAQVYLIGDPEIGYYQSCKMTAAAEFAHKMWKAEWIFPFDADEILCSFRAPLYTILESLDREDICISLPYKVHVLRSFDEQSESNPFKRITHRQRDDVEKGAKIIVRWKSGMVIGQGNHSVTWDDKLLPITKNKNFGLMLRHYPFRSKEHIRRKIINGGRAYAAAQDLPKNQGDAWKTWDQNYQTKGEQYVEEFYATQINGFPDAIYDPAMLLDRS